jgi:O-antigen/teichoic acid export membrane protein
MNLKKSFESGLLYKSEFFRNVLTLITASGISALIPFFASPIITRLYDPKDFAVLALFTTILSISAVFMGLGYDNASMLAKSTKNALNLIFISIFSNIFLILFFSFLVFFIGRKTFFAFFNITILEPYFGLS